MLKKFKNFEKNVGNRTTWRMMAFELNSQKESLQKFQQKPT